MKLVVCDRYRFAFCPLPKNACTSLKEWVLSLEGNSVDKMRFKTIEDRITFIHSTKKLKQIPKSVFFSDPKYSSYKSFIIVRDPCSRLVSVFKDKFINCSKLVGQKNDRWTGTPWQRVTKFINKDSGITFEQFVDFIEPDKFNNFTGEPHWRKQVLLAETGSYTYDHLINFCNLQGEIPKLYDLLCIPKQDRSIKFINTMGSGSKSAPKCFNVLHTQIHPNQHPDSFLNPKIVKKIKEKYKDDYQLLNPFRIYFHQYDLKKLTPGSAGIWKNVVVTVDKPELADHIVILQKSSKKFSRNVIYFQREPETIEKPRLVGEINFTYDSGFHVFTNLNFLGKTFDFLKNYKYSKREKRLCIVMSYKRLTAGHRKRVEYLIRLCKRHPDLVDVYGRGWSKKLLGDCYKGGIQNKFDVLSRYNYTLCFENSSRENYFTEKITDAYLSWCTPIYWGCPNLDNYFPKNSFHLLDIESCVHDSLLKIIDQPVNVGSLRIARDKILNEYNIYEQIYRLLV